MSRPQRVLDEQIRATAREVFLELGPSAPLIAIARRLGFSQAALLHRVGSKEELMREALRPESTPTMALLARGPSAQVPLEDQLVEVLLHHLGYLRRLIPCLFVLRCSELGVARALQVHTPPPVELRRGLVAWLSRARSEGLLDLAEPEPVAEALLGATEARGFNAHVGGAAYAPGDDETVLRGIVRAFLSPLKRTSR